MTKPLSVLTRLSIIRNLMWMYGAIKAPLFLTPEGIKKPYYAMTKCWKHISQMRMPCSTKVSPMLPSDNWTRLLTVFYAFLKLTPNRTVPSRALRDQHEKKRSVKVEFLSNDRCICLHTYFFFYPGSKAFSIISMHGKYSFCTPVTEILHNCLKFFVPGVG